MSEEQEAIDRREGARDALGCLVAESVATGTAAPRAFDFKAGFLAGVEWAEEHGECSLVKFFLDANREAEESYER